MWKRHFLPTPPAYVVVEGLIGVGKTTLVQRLATDLNANMLLEKNNKINDTNPFLHTHLDGPIETMTTVSDIATFVTAQLHTRYDSLDAENEAANALSWQSVVSDYSVDRTAIYIDAFLVGCHETDTDITAAAKVAAVMLFRRCKVAIEQLRAPNIIIYITLPIDKILRRLDNHDPPMQRVNRNYLVRLRAAYERYLATRKYTVIRVDGMTLDDDLEYAKLLRRIRLFIN